MYAIGVENECLVRYRGISEMPRDMGRIRLLSRWLVDGVSTMGCALEEKA